MKCFLSHSSMDKTHYASIVANALRPHIEYDEATFEEGMGNLEEILHALNRSSVFVLLISSNSLNSKWVSKEITEAERRLSDGDLKRFFPIIIDPIIDHTDPRIPDWIKESYNLRPISRPSIAAKRIKERLIEVSWLTHPMLKTRDQIFVGRNAQISAFEQRFDDFLKPQPKIVVASGLNEIGRKTTIRHALRKANLVREAYEPIRIDLARDDNIEGLILKLYDVGVTEHADVSNLLGRSIGEKVALCLLLINDISRQKELILINDHYCVLRFEGELAPWFEDIVNGLPNNKLVMCVVAAARPKRHAYIRNDDFFFIQIPELERAERVGLLKRYLELAGVSLSMSEFANFDPLLKGLPEQITYAASLISELGPERAFKNSYDIVSFSVYRANIIIAQFLQNAELVDFLRFISAFEFVSLEFISKIGASMEKDLTGYIDDLLAYNVCEAIGPSGNYFRVNGVVRDAIIRDRVDIEESYSRALHNFVGDFLSNTDEDAFDVSEYQIAIREALSSGRAVPDRMLIPAHFLQTMKRLYDTRNYKEVVSLADRVLQNKENFDEHTEQDIRYYLCQSLARMTDQRFLDEVQHIKGPEHDFLMGFYYRLQRRFRDALPRYERAMGHKRTEQRARRETVFVLMTIEDYGAAISLARENFQRYPQNPFLAQAYFNCLMHIDDKDYVRAEAVAVLDGLKKMGGMRATEMYENLSARYEFEFGDPSNAFSMIDDVISKYPDIVYPLLTKLDMATMKGDATLLKEAVTALSARDPAQGHKSAIAKANAVMEALSGDVDRAIRTLSRELSQLSDDAKDKLTRRFRRIAEAR